MQVLTPHDLDPESLRLNLPGGPGVYIFKDQAEKIIYVGKAKNLKKRVLSYFLEGEREGKKRGKL